MPDLSPFGSGERGRLKPAPERSTPSSEVESYALKLSDSSNGRSWTFVPRVAHITSIGRICSIRGPIPDDDNAPLSAPMRKDGLSTGTPSIHRWSGRGLRCSGSIVAVHDPHCMDEPNFLLRSDLLAGGTTSDEIRQAVRVGRLRNVTRGVYVDGGADLDPLTLHHARVLARQGRITPDAVVSHVSAAVLHGLPLWDVDLSPVHISRERPSSGRRTPTLHVHRCTYQPDEVCVVAGLRTTTLARTVVDLARTLSVDSAVIAGDAALRAHPHIAPLLLDALASSGMRHGIAAARRTVAFLDGRSESPGESLSRLRIRSAGLPAPKLQHELRTPSGAFVARPDFLWEDEGVVGEFDGRSKYGSDEPGATAETVHREKLREDAIRALGFEVVRWTWADLFRFEAVHARLVRAAGRARRR